MSLRRGIDFGHTLNLNQDDMKKQTVKSSKKTGIKKGKNQKKNDDFPGYPKYPASEDIMNRGERIPLDTDGSSDNEPVHSGNNEKGNRDKNLTDAEVAGQGPDFVENFTPLEEQDEELKNRTYPVDFTGGDLDIPGTELDDASEDTGNEDEENNSYSLGNPKQ